MPLLTIYMMSSGDENSFVTIFCLSIRLLYREIEQDWGNTPSPLHFICVRLEIYLVFGCSLYLVSRRLLDYLYRVETSINICIP